MLVALTTHPIQYQVPIWKALAARQTVPFQVWFMSRHGLEARQDSGFRRSVAWDIDLLGGYDYQFIDVFERGRQDSFSWLTLKSGFRRRLREVGANALWLQGWQVMAYWQAAYLARASGVQIWLRAETNLGSANQQQKSFLKTSIRRNLLQNVDRFLTIGTRNRAFYISQGLDFSRLSFAPYGVDNSRFSAHEHVLRAQRVTLRRNWGIDDDAFVVLFVGKLQHKKRPFDIVEALSLLKRSRPQLNIHSLWAGSGELDDALRARLKIVFDVNSPGTLSRRDDKLPQASFLGFVNQTKIAEVYVAADCLVLPSDADETWGLVVNEAMACGVPCVVSDGCGCSDDLVRPLRPDLCFPVGDTEALSRALEAVIVKPPRREDLDAQVLKYDCLRTVEAIEGLYWSTQPTSAAE